LTFPYLTLECCLGMAAPKKHPAAPYGTPAKPLHRDGDWIWAPLRREWRKASPEEVVRQQIVHRLHARYGYALEQMAQERRTQSGRKSPKADVVVCRDAAALQDNRDYVLVVETKSDNVTIDPLDYDQGESYARAVGSEFLMTHNNKETRVFRLVPGAPGKRIDIEDAPGVEDLADQRRLEAIRRATKAFSREEFRKLLFECHTILRDTHKMEPGQAFDQISKVLFIKMGVERAGNDRRFSREYIDEYQAMRGIRADEVMEDLFADTRRRYRAEGLFDENDHLAISLETFKRLVERLERFNLSSTQDDVKGLAFERFLGQTFRGELGQFFTPRPVVEFMVAMLEPEDGQLVADPASGTGGFLIRWIEARREAIEQDVSQAKEKARKRIARKAKKEGWDAARERSELDREIETLNADLDLDDPDSRLGQVARNCFGVDAEGRAARTSKMNMIMHGDGHGGIYHFDGLLDVGGIFAERFDAVLTNPPFGASVGNDQRVGDSEQTTPTADASLLAEYESSYGDGFRAAHDRLLQAAHTRDPILDLFDIGRDPVAGIQGTAKVRNRRPTEMLFLERALKLLKPGGRLGIVLPEGILNNPSNQWLRDYMEDRARLTAVVSLPQEVFASAKATVKTSLVFIQKLDEDEREQWAKARASAREELAPGFEEERSRAREELQPRIDSYDDDAIAALLAELAELESLEKPSRPKVAEKKREIRDLVSTEHRATRRKLESELKKELQAIDEREEKAVRERFKALVDYPVFFAEVDAAGITSTGATGDDVPNNLPDVHEAFREFRRSPEKFSLQVA
jgi:type I restriction enzyme M protein